VGSLAVVRATGRSEVQARVAHAYLDRNTLYTTTIPGYRPAAFGVWEPRDPALNPADRQVTVIAFGRTFPDSCGDVALDSQLSTSECTIEPDAC
jgi:hypothetical protein